MHDDYKPLDLSQFVTAPPNGRVLEPCPVCGSEAGLWQYSESETSPRKLLAMCSHGDKIGPQDGLIHEGCLLYMPGDNFYRETIRDAVRYWNEMARAIVALRNSNAGVRAMDEPLLALLDHIEDVMDKHPQLEGEIDSKLWNAVTARFAPGVPACATCGDVGMVSTVEYADSMSGFLSGMPCPDCTPKDGVAIPSKGQP